MNDKPKQDSKQRDPITPDQAAAILARNKRRQFVGADISYMRD